MVVVALVVVALVALVALVTAPPPPTTVTIANATTTTGPVRLRSDSNVQHNCGKNRKDNERKIEKKQKRTLCSCVRGIGWSGPSHRHTVTP